MTKWQLFNLLTTHGTANITIKGVTGILDSIQREDGSGSSFILILKVESGFTHVYVRTID